MASRVTMPVPTAAGYHMDIDGLRRWAAENDHQIIYDDWLNIAWSCNTTLKDKGIEAFVQPIELKTQLRFMFITHVGDKWLDKDEKIIYPFEEDVNATEMKELLKLGEDWEFKNVKDPHGDWHLRHRD